jgi:hypothetical protein
MGVFWVPMFNSPTEAYCIKWTYCDDIHLIFLFRLTQNFWQLML